MVSPTSKKKKKQPHTSPKKTNTKKRTRNRTAPKKLSSKPKGQWAVKPTRTILVAFIKETFTSIVGTPSKLIKKLEWYLYDDC